MPSFAPRISGDAPLTCFGPAYQDTLVWLIEEFTELHDGCTVNENDGGYYLSQTNEVVDDRVSVVYSDFPMSWDKQFERTDVLNYCATLQTFLIENLWEEDILIGAYSVSHVLQ